jgi:SulP family sulfate permease
MVGIIQIGLGMLKLGMLVNFLSYPVVLGFVNAGAIIIGTSQTYLLFGVNAPGAEYYYERFWRMIIAAAQDAHGATVGMAAIAFSLILFLRWIDARIPGVLIAVVVTTLISWAVGFETAMGGHVVGAVPKGLPSFQVPQVDFAIITKLFPAAVAIAVIGYVSTNSIARSIATQTRHRIDANQDLIGQGLSNLAGSFFQSYPVSGSFTRSAVNLRAGAQTGFSSVVSGMCVAMTLLWLTPLLYHLPLATLAAIIMASVFRLIRIEPIIRAWKIDRSDGIVALATFALTLIFAPYLDRGILFGTGLSLVLYLYHTMKPRVANLSRHPDGALRDAPTHKLETCEVIAMLRFDGSLYFGSARAFEDMILERVAQNPLLCYVIVDAEGINQIDATGEAVLIDVVDRLKEAKIEVLFARMKMQILDALERTGSRDQIGRDRFFSTPEQALNMVWHRVEDGNLCVRSCPGECPLYRAKPKGAMFYNV